MVTSARSVRGGRDVLSARQAAEFLGAHMETIRRLARRGELPAYKVGQDWRFRRDALIRWMDTHHSRQQSPLVLVVDDEKGVRETTRLFLEAEKFRAATAANGEEALELARREPPDLVLLDLVMPGMHGAEVLRELHAMFPDLPVVIVTGYPDGDLMAEALRYPPLTLLPKPVEKATLIRTVRRVLGGSGVRRRSV